MRGRLLEGSGVEQQRAAVAGDASALDLLAANVQGARAAAADIHGIRFAGVLALELGEQSAAAGRERERHEALHERADANVGELAHPRAGGRAEPDLVFGREAACALTVIRDVRRPPDGEQAAPVAGDRMYAGAIGFATYRLLLAEADSECASAYTSLSLPSRAKLAP